MVYIVITHQPWQYMGEIFSHWTGILEWNTGMDYWTDIFLVLHIFKGAVTVHLGDL